MKPELDANFEKSRALAKVIDGTITLALARHIEEGGDGAFVIGITALQFALDDFLIRGMANQADANETINRFARLARQMLADHWARKTSPGGLQ